MAASVRIKFAASPVLVARIDELAARRNGNRSAAIRGAIVEASLPDDVPAIATDDEVLALLTEAARAGNVPAMKNLLAYHQGRARNLRRPDNRM